MLGDLAAREGRRDASSALNDSTATDATQAKKTLQGFLTAVERTPTHALTKIQSAGTPDISNGKTVAATIVKAFTELRNAHAIAMTKAELAADRLSPACVQDRRAGARHERSRRR